ncbi:putative Cc-nbs-lrr resistance protein [Hibiscus syriacus]|uniref:Cc-nbs-lrr resistance protein n=1 Tax=Hibiscus syriacus TaxID=106335 RepID=A0A6A2YNF9_HIBSY|nr:putative Cc-nbs-lrr resistance protein [Hibiscus syriacus]
MVVYEFTQFCLKPCCCSSSSSPPPYKSSIQRLLFPFKSAHLHSKLSTVFIGPATKNESRFGCGWRIFTPTRSISPFSKPPFFPNDGFIVYDCKGQLVFRVDSYGPGPRDKLSSFSWMLMEDACSPEEYEIEGNFGQRRCRILNASKESMAEIKRKVDASTNVVLGKDVFLLSLKPGFDGAFAMGLVLVIDQVNCDDYVQNYEAEVSSTDLD